jgi:hypothetical protein
MTLGPPSIPGYGEVSQAFEHPQRRAWRARTHGPCKHGRMRATLTREGHEVGVFYMTREGDYGWNCFAEECERFKPIIEKIIEETPGIPGNAATAATLPIVDDDVLIALVLESSEDPIEPAGITGLVGDGP